MSLSFQETPILLVVCFSCLLFLPMNTSPESGSWGEHVEQTKTRPPSEELLRALKHVSTSGTTALELGGGALNDTQFLLKEGWKVTVVDAEPKVAEIADGLGMDTLVAYTSTFDAYDFPAETYDLVNAMYSLSFNQPETFMDMMNRMKASIVKGGIFNGNIFGVHDEWKDNGEMTFLNRVQAEKLFEDMEIIEFKEVERDNILANGTPKHWHVFKVIARKM